LRAEIKLVSPKRRRLTPFFDHTVAAAASAASKWLCVKNISRRDRALERRRQAYVDGAIVSFVEQRS
jgi:hypothetical protein